MGDGVLACFDGLDAADARLNRLPHWQQGVAVVLVTFRLADSLPRAVVAEYNLRCGDEARAGTAQSWLQERLDAGVGECQLRSPAAARVVLETICHRDGIDYRLFSCVVMPNHVHVLFAPTEGAVLSSILQEWKSVTAHRLNRALARTGALWQKDYHDRLIRDWRHFWSAARYIRANPRRARLGPSESLLYECAFVEHGLELDA